MESTIETGTFTAADGLRLYFRRHEPREEARANLVLAHGYSDHAERSDDLAQKLAAQGYAVFGFDFRGHGRSEGPRGHCNRFDDYVSDLQCAIARAEELTPGLPVAILGQSHGALVALSLLCEPDRVPASVKAAVICTPYLGLIMPVPRFKTMLATAASRYVPRLSLPHGLKGAMGTQDVEDARSYDTDPLVHRVASARWFTESTAAQELVAARASRIAIPTLWLLAGNDQVANSATTVRVFERAGGEKRLIGYDGQFHDLFKEPERDRVFADMTSWLSANLPQK